MARTKFSKVFILFIPIFLLACDLSFTGIEYRKGKKDFEKNNFKSAIGHFKKVILRDPSSKYALESARLAARISFFETKQYTDAIDFYKHLIQHSNSEKERRDAQGRIANIYFEKTVNYPKAIVEYNKLLLLPNSNEEIVEYRFNLARAHFYLNEFREAQSEIESSLKISENKEKNFDLMMFLGNIFFNTKRGAEAIKIYQEIIAKYPERAKTDNVDMNIIVCYEDLEEFDKAIEKLEKMRETYRDPEFIELKIRRLKDRKANLPGSRGLRK